MKGLDEILSSAKNSFKGIAAAPGLYIGEAYLYSRENLEISSAKIDNVDEAISSFIEAIERSRKELTKIFSYAKEKMGTKRAEIFEAHLMILDDPVLHDLIINRIKNELVEPQEIVRDEFDKIKETLSSSKDAYFKERADDFEDIKERIIRNLQKRKLFSKIKRNSIVVSELLTPADTIVFTKSNVGAYATEHGGLTSHTAIIARSLNIPAVVGIAGITDRIKSGDKVIVDGFDGLVFVNPTELQLEFFNKKIESLKFINEKLEQLRDKPAITLDGKEITLLANVDATREINHVLYSGAQGVGLFRTEQLIEELGEFPDEEQQVAIYESLSTAIAPHPVTIRAFDLGGDKVRLFHHREANPFLGLRGIRFLLENVPLFKKQIRAVLRSNSRSNIKFMIPMVASFTEIEETRKLIEVCKNELMTEGIPFYPDIKLGIMIEVPAAAVMAESFAKDLDFISVGTNDLIQYLMAVDRGNDMVQNLYQEFNPAVISSLKFIVQAGKRSGAEVSICGEMAADSLAVPLLLAIGFDSLSVSPSFVPSVKRIVTSIEFEKAKLLLKKCLSLKSEDEISAEIEQFFIQNNVNRTRYII